MKERIEYFAQEIKLREMEKQQAELIVRDPEVWKRTYEEIFGKAWRKSVVNTISI